MVRQHIQEPSTPGRYGCIRVLLSRIRRKPLLPPCPLAATASAGIIGQ